MASQSTKNLQARVAALEKQVEKQGEDLQRMEKNHYDLIMKALSGLEEAQVKIEDLEKKVDGMRKERGGSEEFEVLGEEEVKKAKEEK